LGVQQVGCVLVVVRVDIHPAKKRGGKVSSTDSKSRFYIVMDRL